MKPKPESPNKANEKKNSPNEKPKSPLKSSKSNVKGKKDVEEEPEEVIPPPEKIANLERFVYVTVYSDQEAMRRLKELFEEINQAAFQLKSVKEIYTRNLTPEEQDDNNLDYISGCQLIDKNLRITILEGIAGKAMEKIKEKLPRTQMNTDTFKVFSSAKVLFNKRIYSKFELNMKYIKLRDTLNFILTTYDIYYKAGKNREIYNAFLNYGAIMKAKTMLELYEGNLFPDAESLLKLERKYADILTNEDLTGIHEPKKKKKRIRLDNLSEGASNSNISQSMEVKSSLSKPLVNEEDEKNDNDSNERIQNKKALDSHNVLYDQYLTQIHRKTKADINQGNIDYIINMKKKPLQKRFCQHVEQSSKEEDVNFYSSIKNNYYERYLDTMREKYAKDTKNYYTYSLHSLALSFPILPKRNYEYLEYLENKSKWNGKNDFNRYEQPKSEAVYFPRINNVL